MKKLFFLLLLFFSLTTVAQNFSFATGLMGMRHFTNKEKFWAIGQQVRGDFQVTPKETGYASLEYYTAGKFKNNFSAMADSTVVNPSSLPFTATGRLKFREISLGWRHYFKGDFTNTESINLYGEAGFGYLFAKITNSAFPVFDTALYHSPVAFGAGRVRRLSFDAGIGGEKHLGAHVFLFATLRTWLPASYQPSPYLHNNDRVPLALMAGFGLRILFAPY